MEQSRLQRKFKTSSVYKRGKPYFDISRLNRIELKEELSRRRPSEVSSETVESKIDDNFYSSQMKMNERVQTALTKCSTKGWRDEDLESNSVVSTQLRKGKTLDMSKMLARNRHGRHQDRPNDESHFCNFAPYRLPSNHTVNFEKYFAHCEETRAISHDRSVTDACRRCKSRGVDTSKGTPIITEPEVGKAKQKLTFDESLFRTLVDFKKYDKEKSQRCDDELLAELNLERIRLGEEVSQKHPNLGLLQFYHGDVKWNASQMDNRLLKTNQHHLRFYNNAELARRDWLMRKRKTDLFDKRIQRIQARKRIPDIKGEVCDQSYFRRNAI